MSEAFVTPSVLQWARERRDLTASQLAALASLAPDQIELWEQGERRPTLKQASKLAEKLRIPFGYLFLDEPPQLEMPIPDLRTIESVERTEISIDLREVIDDALFKQDWYHDYLLQEGADPLPFLGRFSSSSSHHDISRDILSTLRLEHLKGKTRPANPSAYLKLLIERTEKAGVSVLRSSYVRSNTHRILSVEEFRGFAISDRIAPLVFINGRDAIRGQIFTLMHELAHIWIGESGISDVNLRVTNRSSRRPVETLCNSVAAECLVPAEEFRSQWHLSYATQTNLQLNSKYFAVSHAVVLYRAKENGLISNKEFSACLSLLANQEPKEKKISTGNYFLSLPYRNGRKLSAAILAETINGALSFRDAADLLNTKASTIRKAAKEYGLTS